MPDPKMEAIKLEQDVARTIANDCGWYSVVLARRVIDLVRDRLPDLDAKTGER